MITMTNHGELGERPSDQPNKNFSVRLPKKFRPTGQVATIILIFLLTWGFLYVQIGDAVAPPRGQLFRMTVLVMAAYVVGWLFVKVTSLPALMGMLATGLLLSNTVPGMCQWDEAHYNLNRDLRKISLVIILTRAGLGLDAAVLKRHYAAVLQLGLLPWLVECVMIALTTHYLLDLPWIWGFLLGSMIASVSPAVVVPGLFRLREQGYGVAKGVPTIILAACAIDDSISVAIFAIILNAMFSDGSLVFNIIKGPVSIIVGIAFGSFFGALASVIPERGDTYLVPLRFLVLFTSGLFALFMSNFIGWSGAGPLAVVSSGFVASYLWSREGWLVNNNPVSHVYRVLWIFFEPILFAFTGAQIVIKELDTRVVYMGAVCLVACLLIRLVATFLISFGCGLNSKEKLFIGFTWMAKATVQAALGPAALDLVRHSASPDPALLHRGETLLTVSVLSVVVSAPLGALLIAVTGPALLSRATGGNGESNLKNDASLESSTKL